VSEHIDDALGGWTYDPDALQARLVKGGDGRPLIQMRVDLGILQLETTGRPDGTKPHGCRTYLDHLRRQKEAAERRGEEFVLDEEQCRQADREFVQFYHRRICWLALQRYAEAVADADHTLAFMDLVRDHAPSEDYARAHELYRGFVTFQRTQGAAALALEKDDPEAAIDEVRQGLGLLLDFFAERGEEGRGADDGMVRHLRKMEEGLRREHHIEETLRERLDRAVAAEDYELAARLRDELRQRGC
jgi:hypothetical protein